MRFCYPVVVFLLFFVFIPNAFAGQYLPMMQNSSGICEEIGMKENAPADCLFNMVNYKGRTCYKCRGRDKCSQACSGGKICVDSKCVCPPNSGLVDCNGVCVRSFQCQGLAAGRRGGRVK